MNDSLDLRKRILKMRENNVSLNEVEPKNIKHNENIPKSTLLNKNNNKTQKNKIAEQNINEEIKNDLVDNNEPQFRILASKFNEAVEVILELSEKVKKLEKKVYKEEHKLKKGSFFSLSFNLKILIFFILVPLFILGIFTLPFDTSIIQLMLMDIISSI